MKFGPQILRCKVCGQNPLLSVRTTGLGYTEAKIWCSHIKGGQESLIASMGSHRNATLSWLIHDWNFIYGKGYGP